jgi:hypothetical protein
MIRLRDATMLALTKLRTRKIRLTITIVVSGLLFGGLAGSSFVVRGIMGGIASFSKEGLGDRYIVQVYPQQGYSFMNDSSVIDRAIAIQKDIITRKKAEAKRLGIVYDSASEPSPVDEYSNPGGGPKQRYLKLENPAATQAVQEYLATRPLADKKTLESNSAPYHPKGIYESQQVPYNIGGATLQVLKEGKESFTSNQKGEMGPPTGTDSFVSTWSAMSSGLLRPFILPGQNLEVGQDGSIPIIVPNTAAEQILQLKALSPSATSAERLARIKQIRSQAPSLRFQVCYRNAASADLVGQAVAISQEIEQNKNKKDYQKPSLIYGLPTKACGAVPITRDVRTKDEKTLAAKQDQFDQLFGEEPASQTTLTFRIVGIVPDPDYGGGPAFGVGQIIRSLVTSSLGNGWYMPDGQLADNPLIAKLFSGAAIFGGGTTYYTEFSAAANARSFIEKENCDLDYSKLGPNADAQVLCEAQHHPFGLAAYGSNSLALESAKRTFGKFFRLAALAVSVIACIIMMGTVGRMIADSRRETAVFRAIGAKKTDIAQIYLTYTVCLSLLIAVFAILAGLILALWANHHWSPEITIQALIAYNAQDLNKTFSIYAFYLPDMLLLAGLSVAAGLLSATLPLFRNSRRNPIRDMRDDT